MKALFPSRVLRRSLPALWLSLLLSSAYAGPAPIANGKIAFSHLDQFTKTFQIYAMDPDGSNQTNLTNNPSNNVCPAWSPDGTKIAFDSNRDGNGEIYLMNADGSKQTRLTNNAAEDLIPAWSPDGARIAFQSNRDGDYEIYVMEANGANQTRLTNSALDDYGPVWSPDGTKIAFATQRDGNFEIYVMDADGSDPTRLTNDSRPDNDPAWSPDGTRIAFTSNRDFNDEIYLMNANGSNQIRLTNHVASDWEPGWAPDGTKIVFTSQRDANFEIYVMDADGSNPANLTHSQDDVDDTARWQRLFVEPTPTPTAGTPTPTPGSPTPTPTPIPSPTAACTPLPPAIEGFGNITTLVPSGWFMQNNSQPGPGITSWFQGNTAVFPAHSGNADSYIGTNFNNGSGTSTLSNWLLTPTMIIGDGAGLTFFTRTVDTPTFPDRLQVRLNTNGASVNVGTSATDVGDFTTLLLDINPTYAANGYPDTWTSFSVVLHDMPFPFTGRFAFRYFVENGGPGGNNSDYIGIDSVVIGPGCGGSFLPTPTPAPSTPTPTPGTPTPTPSTTPTPSPTPTPPPPSPTATPTPSGTPTRAINLSTRMRAGTGDDVAIAGFIIAGSAPRKILLRAIGPSLGGAGIANPLADPVMELHGTGGFATIINNNWRDSQEVEIAATGAAPPNNVESAILATLDPGAYTAIVYGNGNTAGIGLVEVYDLDPAVDSKLANLSTRAHVGLSENVVIAGFLLEGNGGQDKVIVRGIGPSLAPGTFPVSAVLADPTLELRDSNGGLVLANNDWQDDAAQAAEITAAGLALGDAREAAIAAMLPPGAFTVLLLGGTGLGVVEIYDLGP